MSAGRHIPRPPEPVPGAPAPLRRTLVRTVHFYEVDSMGIMWFGNYCRMMDEAGAHLRAMCGLSYDDFRREGIMAPVKRMEVDYKLPLVLGERAEIVASMPWNEAMRIDTEFTIHKQDGRVAATGWMVQLLASAPDMAPIYVETPLIARIRERWRRGEFLECQ
jgi:acyl-CoA thioester hydrolase